MPVAFEFASLPFDEKLDRFAQLAVRVGLNLQPGQELLISATTEMMPLVRRITEHAYKAGALLVTTFYSDDEAVLARYRYASNASFDHAAQWMADSIAAAFSGGAARLALAGSNPALLAGQDPAKISRANVSAKQGQQAGDGADYTPCDQLVDSCLSNASLGKTGLPRAKRGRRCREALGGNLYRFPGNGRGSRWRHGRRTRSVCMGEWTI